MLKRLRGCYAPLAVAGFLLMAGPPGLQAETLTFDPPAACVTHQGDTICIKIVVSNVGANPILGGQFFLEYDGPPGCWEFVSASPVAPFNQLYEIVVPPQNPPVPGDPPIPGTIDYAVSVPVGNPGITVGQPMAIICLRALDDSCCEQELRFRNHAPPTRLGIAAGGIEPPALVLPGPAVITLDWHAPVLTCDAPILVPVDGNCEAVMPDLIADGYCSVEDNCCPVGSIGIHQDPAPGTPMELDVPVDVTLTLTDCCGNEAVEVKTVTAVDQTPPVWPNCLGSITLPANCGSCTTCCLAKVPDLVGEGLMDPPTDNCEDVCQSAPGWYQFPAAGQCIGQGGIIEVWAVDMSGNSTVCQVVVTVEDTTPPTILDCPDDREVAADENCAGEVPDLCPEVIGTDNCKGTFDKNGHPLPGRCSQSPAPGTPMSKDIPVTVTVTVTDTLGNSDSCEVEVTATDQTDPEITCPDDIEVYADACTGTGCKANVSFSVSAVDNCDLSPVIVCMAELQDGDPELDTVNPAGTVFPTGTTTVTCTATDDDGNAADCSFEVNVLAENEIQVQVMLDGAPAPGPFTRCVKFEVFPCVAAGGPPVPPVLRQATIQFAPNRIGSTVLTVPCGCYGWIVAQDPLHTVRSALVMTTTPDCTDYVANFLAPADRLLGGDVDDDGYADIWDVAYILGHWGACYGAGCHPPCCNPPVGDPNTDCSFPAPGFGPPDTFHCDISADGFVGLPDLMYLTQATNFLKADETRGTPPPGAATSGRTAAAAGPVASRGPAQSVTVQQLQRRGLNAAALDLNSDKVFDMKDVRLFMQAQAGK